MSETLPQLYRQTAEALECIERGEVVELLGKDRENDRWRPYFLNHCREDLAGNCLLWRFLRIKPAENTAEPRLTPFTFKDDLLGDIFRIKGDGRRIRAMATRQDERDVFLAVGQVSYAELLTSWEYENGDPAGRSMEEGQ